VGLALPGPFRSEGVLDFSANLPSVFEGWDFLADCRHAIAAEAGHNVFVATANDGNLGGLAEAALIQRKQACSVLMLSLDRGLGTAFIDARGQALAGDNFAGMEAAHMPAPLHMLNLPAFSCGCGRDWACIEPYTTLSGLPQYLKHLLPEHRGHELTRSPLPPDGRALALRGLAQKGDGLALKIFRLQSKALGYHIANLALALDPKVVVVGGDLLDPEHTTESFRQGFLDEVLQTALPYLFPAQRRALRIVPASLGNLSKVVGAALLAQRQAHGGR